MNPEDLATDPLAFVRLVWPKIKLYDKQAEILRSLVDNYSTVVPAGNELGKDFLAGLACVWFFSTRKPCRIVTHSVDAPQLKGVMWGEIRKFVETAQYNLPFKLMDDMMAYQLNPDGSRVANSYMIGRVTRKGEGLSGHHLPTADRFLYPFTMFLSDEASGVDDEAWEKAEPWAHRMFTIGNPYPCQNYFYRTVEAGDVPSEFYPGRFDIKVLHLAATDSPNVALQLERIKRGKIPNNKQMIIGPKDYQTYSRQLKSYDEVMRCIKLNGKFWKGGDTLLFPPVWLDRAETKAKTTKTGRLAVSMGLDSAEGGDSTVWTPVNHSGIIDQISLKTRNTAIIRTKTKALIRQYFQGDPKENARKVILDAGGGGKQHADYLREDGYEVRTVSFAESPSDPFKAERSFDGRKWKPAEERVDEDESRKIYKNRRAEMYHMASQLLDPVLNENGFAIPSALTDLRTQLAILPKLWDGEGKLYLPPKDKPNPEYKGQTIKQMLGGRSPDEADSFVLAVFGMLRPEVVPLLGSF